MLSSKTHLTVTSHYSRSLFLKVLHLRLLEGTGSVQKVKLLFPKDPEEQVLTRKRAATP